MARYYLRKAARTTAELAALFQRSETVRPRSGRKTVNLEEELADEEAGLEEDIVNLLRTTRAIADKQIRLTHIKLIRQLINILPPLQNQAEP